MPDIDGLLRPGVRRRGNFAPCPADFNKRGEQNQHFRSTVGAKMTVFPKSPLLRECCDCTNRSSRTFCNLTPQALAEFDVIGDQETLPKGTTLFHENAPSNRVTIICAGLVKLSCTSKEGKTLILKMAKPGDVLGLGAVIANFPHETTAVTVEATQIKSIPAAEFMEFLKKHGEASLNAATAISSEYKAVVFDARRLALSGSIAGRLATLLLEWGRNARRETSEMRFTMALTHEDLAAQVGTSRETATRLMGRFQRDKLIEVRGSSILILSPEGLERFTA